jgi:hypothetical protein
VSLLFFISLFFYAVFFILVRRLYVAIPLAFVTSYMVMSLLVFLHSGASPKEIAEASLPFLPDSLYALAVVGITYAIVKALRRHRSGTNAERTEGN